MDLFDFLPFIIIGVIILAIVLGIIATRIYERKRTERFEQVAEQLGLPFFKEGDPQLVEALGALHLFSQGRAKRLYNMIHGETEDVDLAVFDYKYTIGSGKSTHTHSQTVVYIHCQDLDLPKFALRPQHFFHRIGKIFGYQDIDFETHPTFSGRYILQGDEETRIREVFRDELLAFFEGLHGVSAEASGGRLVYYRAGKRINPDEVRTLMEEGFRLFALIRGSTA